MSVTRLNEMMVEVTDTAVKRISLRAEVSGNHRRGARLGTAVPPSYNTFPP